MGRFCEDLVADILSCMPIKSVVRFRCLSKYYNEITSDQRFAANHALRSTPEVHGLFQFTDLDAGKTLFFSLHNNSQPNIYEPPNNFTRLSPILASCNGLFLLSLSRLSLCVLNPTTDNFKIIPKSKASCRCSKWHLGLAYDPIAYSSLNYKLVHVYRDQLLTPGVEIYGFEIFDLSADSWRISKYKLSCRIGNFLKLKNQGVYLDGIMHWLRIRGDIITFDVEREMPNVIPLPQKLKVDWCGHKDQSWFGAANGLIYLVYVSNGEIVMWVLHDYENNKWGRVRNQIRGLPSGAYPIFFDGERLVFECGEPKKTEIHMYNMKLETWNKIGRLPINRMGGTNDAYVPFIPTLVPIGNGSPSTGDSSDCVFESFQALISRKYQCKKRKQEAVASDYHLRSRTR